MVTKKATAKKPTKKTVKKAVSKKRVVKKVVPMRSFRVYKETRPFTELHLSRQTLYWTIFLAAIIATQLWIVKIQMDIITLTAQLAG